MLKMKPMMRTAFSMAASLTAAAALLCLDSSPSRAQYFGDAPWCAVVQVGTGGVHWDCQYNTIEACVPNVLAGNRGFCGMNPYYRPSAQQRSPAPYYRHHYYPHPHKHSHNH
jgi:Protein of unknown function (DUF3551)